MLNGAAQQSSEVLCHAICTLPVLLAIRPAHAFKGSITAPKFISVSQRLRVCGVVSLREFFLRSLENRVRILHLIRGLTAQRNSAFPSVLSTWGSLSTVTRFARLVIGEMPLLIQGAPWGAKPATNSWHNHYVCASEVFNDMIAVACHFVSCVGSKSH